MNAIAHASTAPAGPQLDNRRVLAGVIDLAIILAGGFVLSSVLAFATGGEAGLSSRLALIMVGWALYYYFAFESGDGQTVGKKLMKLRVVRVDGAPLGMREVTLRTLLRVVDGPFVPLIGLIVMMVTGERRQRLGDLAAGTMVADASAEPADARSEAVAAPVAEPEAPAEPVTAEPETFSEPVAAEEPVHQGFAPPALAPDPDFAPPVVVEGVSAPQETPVAPESSDFDSPMTQDSEPEAEPSAEVLPLEPAAELEVEQPSFPPPVAVRPAAEAPVLEQAPVVEEAPVAEEPVVEAPVAEERVVEESTVEEAPAEDPFAPEPVAEQRAPEQPQDAEPTPEESLAALMGHPAPAEEPADAESAQPEPEEETMTVRPMETVSAIDLIMGADEDRDESPEGDDGPQPQPE